MHHHASKQLAAKLKGLCRHMQTLSDTALKQRILLAVLSRPEKMFLQKSKHKLNILFRPVKTHEWGDGRFGGRDWPAHVVQIIVITDSCALTWIHNEYL